LRGPVHALGGNLVGTRVDHRHGRRRAELGSSSDPRVDHRKRPRQRNYRNREIRQNLYHYFSWDLLMRAATLSREQSSMKSFPGKDPDAYGHSDETYISRMAGGELSTAKLLRGVVAMSQVDESGGASHRRHRYRLRPFRASAEPGEGAQLGMRVTQGPFERKSFFPERTLGNSPP
jgi:hypothetical protein